MFNLSVYFKIVIKKYITIKYKKISLSIIVFCRNKILSKIIVGVDWKWIILKPLSSAMHNTGCNRSVFTWLGICIVTLLQKLLIRQCVYCLAICAEWLNVEYVVHCLYVNLRFVVYNLFIYFVSFFMCLKSVLPFIVVYLYVVLNFPCFEYKF